MKRYLLINIILLVLFLSCSKEEETRFVPPTFTYDQPNYEPKSPDYPDNPDNNPNFPEYPNYNGYYGNCSESVDNALIKAVMVLKNYERPSRPLTKQEIDRVIKNIDTDSDLTINISNEPCVFRSDKGSDVIKPKETLEFLKNKAKEKLNQSFLDVDNLCISHQDEINNLRSHDLKAAIESVNLEITKAVVPCYYWSYNKDDTGYYGFELKKIYSYDSLSFIQYWETLLKNNGDIFQKLFETKKENILPKFVIDGSDAQEELNDYDFILVGENHVQAEVLIDNFSLYNYLIENLKNKKILFLLEGMDYDKDIDKFMISINSSIYYNYFIHVMAAKKWVETNILLNYEPFKFYNFRVEFEKSNNKNLEYAFSLLASVSSFLKSDSLTVNGWDIAADLKDITSTVYKRNKVLIENLKKGKLKFEKVIVRMGAFHIPEYVYLTYSKSPLLGNVLKKEAFFLILEEDTAQLNILQNGLEDKNVWRFLSNDQRDLVLQRLNNSNGSVAPLCTFLKNKKYRVYLSKKLL